MLPEHVDDRTGYTILIVDDEPMLRTLLMTQLRGLGYVPAEAANGAEALQRLRVTTFDLVITDICMPVMDGFQLMSHIKAEFPGQEVIIMTGLHGQYTYDDVIQSGAIDFLAKPFGTEEVKAKLRRAFRERDLIHSLQQEVAGHRQTSISLKESEEKYRQLLAEINDGIFRTDLTGNLTFANPSLARIHGCNHAEDLVGTNFLDLIHPDEQAEVRTMFADYLRQEAFPEELTLPIVRGQSQEKGYARLRLKSISKEGVVNGITGTVTDVTEKVQVEAEKEKATRLNELLLNSIPHPAMIINKERVVLAANRVAQQFGALIAGVCWRDFYNCKFIDEQDRGKADSEIKCNFCLADEAMSEGQPRSVTNVDAFSRKWQVWWVPIEKESFLGYSIDISEHERLEQELYHAKTAAENASLAKSEFLANMSHEIRTPMNAILGMTNLALDTDLTAAQHKYLSIVKSSGEALLSLINDILDFSKIEAGQIVLEEKTFDLYEVVENTAQAMACRAYDKGLDLICHLAANLPSRVVGDPFRLRQILINLLGNAIKFTERGHVCLTVKKVMASEESTTIRFSVSDTGPGIPPEAQERIFARFEQVDTSVTRTHGGTGLGLSISKRLTELMGGEIWLQSEQGRGSTFHCTTRLGKAPLPPAATDELPDLLAEASPVLVVGGHPLRQAALIEALSSWGFPVDEAGDTKTASDMLPLAERRHGRYRLLIVDQEVDGGQGLDFINRLPTDTAVAPLGTILLVSPLDHETIAAAQQSPLCWFMHKPVSRGELKRQAMMALRGKGPTPVPVKRQAKDVSTPALPVMRLLLVEDNEFNRDLAIAVLEKLGQRVDAAANGLEALKAMGDVRYDGVLMDVQMPVLDGYETTRLIRECEQGRIATSRYGDLLAKVSAMIDGQKTTIVAMTAHAMAGDRGKCLVAGMDDYLTKPFETEQIIGVLAKISGNAYQTPASVDERSSAEAETEPGARRITRAQIRQHLDDSYALPPEKTELMITSAINSLHAELGKADQALAQSDLPTLSMCGHTIKGVLHNLGLDEVAAIGYRIEKLQTRTEEPLAIGIGELLKILRRTVSELLATDTAD